MLSEKIALIVDSCTDVIPQYVQRFKMYTVPLLINYREGSYRDKIDITPDEVYSRFATEIPKTSLPSPSAIREVFDQAIADGCNKAVVVSISSGLSGTFETMQMVAKQTPELECEVIDTKNIAIGAGFTAIQAGELIEQGVPFAKLRQHLTRFVANTKIFFCVDTLEYLKAGGRIGEVTYRVGNLLDMHPIISCNDKGVYYTAKMARGRRHSIKKLVDLARKFSEGFARYNIAVMHADAHDEAEGILAQLREHFPRTQAVLRGQISPALIVHTGPGLVGIGVQGLS
jgi:DegV family protein with EDD domain